MPAAGHFYPGAELGSEWMPYTIIGDRDWKDYEVAVDLMLDGGGWAGVMGRIGGTGSGWGCNQRAITRGWSKMERFRSGWQIRLRLASRASNSRP